MEIPIPGFIFPPAIRRARLRLSEIPFLIEVAQTKVGKVVIAGLFSALLYSINNNHWNYVGIGVLFISLLPNYRRLIMAIAALAMLSKNIKWSLIDSAFASAGIPDFEGRNLVLIALIFSYCAISVNLVYRNKDWFLSRRPVLVQLLIYLSVLGFACFVPLSNVAHVALWSFLFLFRQFFWFLAYSLLDRNSPKRISFFKQIGNFHPFWGYANIPTPKGEGYLRQVEAKNEKEAAVIRLKGLQLIAWAAVLQFAYLILEHMTSGKSSYLTPILGWLPAGYLPPLSEFIGNFNNGISFSKHDVWLAVVINFVTFIMKTAIWGHGVIAGARLAGFNAFRITYKPAYATTIAEFYNRIHYYFKEMLVEFFFYPAYLRYFKNHPRLRIFFATFSAACVGNIISHFFFGRIDRIFDLGLVPALRAFLPYVFYGVVLGFAIAVSQIRLLERKKNPQSYQLPDFLKIFCVLFFYAIIMIFDDPLPEVSLGKYLLFVGNLFY